MKLVYHLSDEARKRLFVEAGRDPGRVQELEVDPADLSREGRELLVTWGFGLQQQVTLNYNDANAVWGSTTKYLTLDTLATDPAELLAVYRDACEAGAARLFDADEARIAREIEQFRARNSEREPSLLNTSVYQRSPRRQEWLDAHAAAKTRAKEVAQQLAAAHARDVAQREAEKAAREAERRAWIEAHGSPYLKKCLAGGYDCQRRYVLERAAVEHPDYTLDYNDAASWKDRSAPSEAALDEAARVGGTVVWLTVAPSYAVPDRDIEDYDEPLEPCEAVVIREYLGKYDLIKVV